MFQFVTLEKDNHEVVINLVRRILQLIPSIAAAATRKSCAGKFDGGKKRARKACSEASTQHCPVFAGV
jgi:hypothetical protein